MATDVGVGDVILTRIGYSDGSSVAYNVVHYRVSSIVVTSTGLPSPTAIPAGEALPLIAQHLYNYFGGFLEDVLSDQVTFTDVMCQDISPSPRSRPYSYAAAEPIEGAVASESLPMQDAVTLLKRTAIGQRWGLGRIFVPGIPESFQDLGGLTLVAADLYAPVAAAFGSGQVVPVGGNSVGLVPVLYRPARLAPPTPELITPITSVGLSSRIIKTQRRRRPGKGI